MSEHSEERLRSIASGLDYPLTPDVANAVLPRLSRFNRRTISSGVFHRATPRQFAWVVAIVMLLLSGLLFVAPVRAAILEFIQIGVVRIFRTGTEVQTPTSEAPPTALPGASPPLTATPASNDSSLLIMLDGLTGEMTLEEAQQTLRFPIHLPAYPSDLGVPDRIFVQEVNGRMVIFVWLEAGHPEKVEMSLHIIPEGSWAIEKVKPIIVQETTVNGRRALWTEGPYPLILRSRDIVFSRMITGHVLIWTSGEVTYRLETALPLEQAIKIAESLQPIPSTH